MPISRSEFLQTVQRYETRLAHLEELVTDAFLRAPQGGGGSFTIATVSAFPAIPTKPTIVFYTGEPNNAQLWAAGPGHTRWNPMERFTAHTGTPAL